MRLHPVADSSAELAIPFPLSKEIVKFDRMPPFVAGSITGVLGGGAMIAVVDAIVRRHSVVSHPFVRLLATRFDHALSGPWPDVLGIAIFIAVAAIVSGVLATLTQRLRRIVPLLLWTALFSCALWILGDAILIGKFHAIGDRLPFLPLLAGAEVFAILSCLQLPLRVGLGVVEVAQPRDSFV